MEINAESSFPKYKLKNPSTYLICPMCYECFPQITSVRIYNEKLQISLMCTTSPKINDFEFEHLIELLKQSTFTQQGKCCLKNSHSSEHTNKDKTKYCIVCNEWFCDKCRTHHDALVYNERNEQLDTYTHDGVNHLFIDRKIMFSIKHCYNKQDDDLYNHHGQKIVIKQDIMQTKGTPRYYCESMNMYFCEGCKIDKMYDDDNNNNTLSTWIDIDKAINDLLPIRDENELKQNEDKFVNNLNAIVEHYVLNNKNKHSNDKNDIQKQINIIRDAFQVNKNIHGHYNELYKLVNNNFRLMLYVNLYNHNIVLSMNNINKFQQINNHNNNNQYYNYDFYDLQRILKTEFYYNISELDATFCFAYRQHYVESLYLYKSILLSIGTKLKQSNYPYFKQTNVSISNKLQIKGLCILKDKTVIAYSNDKFLHYKPNKNKPSAPFEGWLCDKYDHKHPIWAVKEYFHSTKQNYESFLLVADAKNISVISTLKLKETSRPIYKYKHNFNAISQDNISITIRSLLQLHKQYFAYGSYETINILSISDKLFTYNLKCKNTNIQIKKENEKVPLSDIVSSLVKINDVDLYACGLYDRRVVVWNYFENSNKGVYYQIGEHLQGVVDLISRKPNELLSLSADGACHVRMIRIIEGNIEWKHIFTFETKMKGGISFISMSASEHNTNIKENIVICAKDQIEMWYVNTGFDSFDAPYPETQKIAYEQK